MTQNKKASKRSSESQSRIRTMRQGQQKIKLDIKKPSPSLPPLPLPFPPTQKVEQIVTKLVAKPRLARFPNAFIMYRNEYVLFLKSKNYHISMTELSPMISTSWKKEPEYVKETYTKLSSDAEKMYVRETGNTQPQINYKYLPTQRPTLKEYSSKLEPEISIPKLNESHLPQLNASNYDFFNDFNIYDRLLQSFSISAPNAFQRNFAKEPPVNGDIAPFSIGTTSELAKYSLEHSSLSSTKMDNPIVHQENCFTTDPNFFPWTPNISPSIQDDLSNIHSPTHLPQTPHCFSPSFSPTTPLEDLMNSPALIGLDTQMLESMESMSPCSTSSSPSDASSFDDISSLLFSSELDESRFFEKAGFSAPAYTTESINAQSSLQSSDLYHLYSGQSFATPSTVFNDKI